MKLGRNDPCWCKSGVKYKKCHLHRDQEKPVSRGEAEKVTKGFTSPKYCSVPEAMKDRCSKKIIRAHTVSKSSCLAEISDETNHVLGLKPSLSSLDKNSGIIHLEKIGINRASTFGGFCSFHDKTLFSPIEDNEFIYTDEQCFLLAYRAVAKEQYAKQNQPDFIELLKQSDRGKGVAQQKIIQAFANSYRVGMEAAVEELSEFKGILEQYLISRENSPLKHFIVAMDYPPPVMVSSILAPTVDFKGKIIQDLNNLEVVPECIVYNSFSSSGKGYIVLSWLNGHEIIDGFVDSLEAVGIEEIVGALLGFFFIYSENVYIAPRWWESLDNDQQKNTSEKIMHGVIPLNTSSETCLKDCVGEYGKFEIREIVKINF